MVQSKKSRRVARSLELLPDVVKKSNELIRGSVEIDSIDSARILAALIASLPKEEGSFNNEYTIRAVDACSCDMGGKDYARIAEACTSLMKAHVTITRKNAEGDTKLDLYAFFTHISYEDGLITAKFAPEIEPFLLRLMECYTRYSLAEYMTLPSTYSQRLFEILKSWSGREEVIIPVEDLHRMLNTPPSLQSNFKDLRVRVLEKAHTDIMAGTSFWYTWSPVKTGRSVTAIKFGFIKPCSGSDDQEESSRSTLMPQVNTDKRNKNFIKALECRKLRGESCTGGFNTKAVCDICHTLKQPLAPPTVNAG